MENDPFLEAHLVTLGVTFLLGVLAWAMPGLTRSSLYFGVTVEPAFRRTPEASGALRLYRVMVAAGTVAALLAGWRLDPVRWGGLAAAGPPVLVMAAMVAGFLSARRRVLPHRVAPPSEREAVVLGRRTSLPGGAPAQAGPFLILAGAAVWLAVRWDAILQRFPVHWGMSGRPDAWALKTPGSVFGQVLSALLVVAVLWVLALGVARWSRRIAASGPEARKEERFRRVVLWVILAGEYLVAGSFFWVAAGMLLPSARPPGGARVVGGLTLLAAVLMVALLVRTGQGGWRLAGGARDTEEEPRGDRSDDRYWKAGLLYVNREDPAILVEKRFGIGYTLNFGNPWSWVILAVLLIPALVALLLAAR